ncbi:MAG: hypothetical protein J7D60_01360 [Prosthecochloris sp.]|nr:hypothetical protein [Prosthecochloris sp.]
MTGKTEHINSIEERLHELEESITRRQKELKERAVLLKEGLHDELSPEELVRKYPFQLTAASLLAGFITGKAIRAISGPPAPTAPARTTEPSEFRSALGNIGADILHSGKDLAFTYLRYYLDRKIKGSER